jgi:hypothetical protein
MLYYPPLVRQEVPAILDALQELVQAAPFSMVLTTHAAKWWRAATKLTEQPRIAAYGAGYRPHMQYPLVESYLPHQQRSEP